MGTIGLRVWVSVCVVAVSLLLWRTNSDAISLDKEGDIKFGVRTYVNARVGTEATHDGSPASALTLLANGTFPHSDAGHLRQNRFFIEAEMNHDLSRLLREGVGPLSLLNDLPFKFKTLSYHLTFRGEGEGLYDWGPKEYSTARESYKVQAASPPNILINRQQQEILDVAHARQNLRHLGTDRERLFQAYLEVNVGDLFLRFGRQILSWGETDGFQLLDHINPLDSSFGGFLIGLDERRVPLDMLLANYYLGGFGPISEAYLEGYVSTDNSVGYYPGTPSGSAWTLPGIGAPSNNTNTFIQRPAQNVENARGGFLLKFNAMDATFSLAHYYTRFDVPAVQVTTTKSLLNAFDDGMPCPVSPGSQVPDPDKRHCGSPTHAFLTGPKVQVSGVTTTFAVPQVYSVVRSELAYFKDQPSFTQGQLDPFIFNPLAPSPTSRRTGGRRLGESINFVLGVDMNQWIRVLNPNQTILISTQFFFSHIRHGADGPRYNPDGTLNADREVLPVAAGPPANVIFRGANVGPLEPNFISQPINTYLHTLFIGTSYRSGTINPGLVLFYDWGGGFVYQPSVTFIRDPFRFTMDYSILSSHNYKGGSGVSLLKDRDNIQFRFEYVI